LSSWVITDNPHVSYLDIEGVWQWTSKREQFRAEYAELWNATAKGTKMSNGGGKAGGMGNGDGKATEYNDMIDVILCPAGPGVAPPLDCAKYWGYTSLWNLLDFPALVFPVSRLSCGGLKLEEHRKLTALRIGLYSRPG
jgi:amidase